VSTRRVPLLAALLLAAGLAGCGLGAGPRGTGAAVLVTRDFGGHQLGGRIAQDLPSSETAMRLLQRDFKVTTRYGGGFVQSIDGVEEAERGGRPYDWFFYVDGIESPIGATDYSLQGSERIWWDYRDWSATDHVPAVVGSYPAPFADGYEGKRHPVAVDCEGGGGACARVRGALAEAGVSVAAGSPGGAIRVLVGPWARLRSDPAAALIEAGPAESGVYADFERRGGGYALVGLDAAGKPSRDFGPSAGLVAATRRYEAPPTWVVTGATPAAVQAAAGLLDAAKLRDHYAVASEDGKETPLPLRVR
jgi:hypothetical protein